jgi:hypothetical protein
VGRAAGEVNTGTNHPVPMRENTMTCAWDSSSALHPVVLSERLSSYMNPVTIALLPALFRAAVSPTAQTPSPSSTPEVAEPLPTLNAARSWSRSISQVQTSACDPVPTSGSNQYTIDSDYGVTADVTPC